MEDPELYLQKICKSNEMEFLNNLLENANDTNAETIKNIIVYNKFKNVKNNKKNNTQKYTNNDVEKYLYKRPWNKLHSIQKKNKLNEFVHKIMFKCDNFHEIKLLIFDKFKSNKLNSNKVVNYDPVSTKILSIKGLKFDTETNLYLFN